MQKLVIAFFACLLLASFGCAENYESKDDFDALVADTFAGVTVLGSWKISGGYEYLLLTVDGRMLRVVGDLYEGASINSVEELNVDCQATAEEPSSK